MTASVAGTSHVRVGAGCQDAHRILIDETSGTLIVAVADGAGSAARAAEGAELATEVAAATLLAAAQSGDLNGDTMTRAFANARDAVFAHAYESGAPAREFASTLLVLAVTATGGFAAQIGDGLIAVRDHDDWAWVIWPQRGEYANMTRFLVEEDALDRAEFVSVGPAVLEAALMTDGLEPLALHYASESVHSPFFDGMLPPLRAWNGTGEHPALSAQLSAFLQSPRITERADDDLTLVMATRG